MGRYSAEPQGGDFEKAPLGTHLGICYRIIDLGTQHKEFDGEARIVKEVMISWELPGETMADGRPFSISGFYTDSLHEKAKLRAHLAAWRGRDFTKDELARFDKAALLDKPALVNIGRTESGKEKLISVIAIPKGMPIPKRSNPLQAFFIDEWDDVLYKELPDGIKKLIAKSEEFKAVKGIVPEDEESWPSDEPAEEKPPF